MSNHHSSKNKSTAPSSVAHWTPLWTLTKKLSEDINTGVFRKAD